MIQHGSENATGPCILFFNSYPDALLTIEQECIIDKWVIFGASDVSISRVGDEYAITAPQLGDDVDRDDAANAGIAQGDQNLVRRRMGTRDQGQRQVGIVDVHSWPVDDEDVDAVIIDVEYPRGHIERIVVAEQQGAVEPREWV